MSFRELSRKKQQLSREECIEILMSEPRGVLSVNGDDGYPYGFPIDHWYCPRDGKIYFHCGKLGYKLDAIKNNDKVSFCVCDKGSRKGGDWALYVKSVIIFGRIRIIDEPERAIEITRQLSYKYTSDACYIEDEIKKYSSGVLVLELSVEHMTGKLVHEA